MISTDVRPRAAVHEIVRYFPRQLISADDMNAAQDYIREKLRRHNRYLHGWGIVCGLEVKADPTDTQPWRVRICPGYALTPNGDEIEVPKAPKVYFDLATGWSEGCDPCASGPPCAPPDARPTGERTVVYMAICYRECMTRPVRVHPAGCGCDEVACEYSRVRESFEPMRSWDLPESHKQAQEAEKAWLEKVETWRTSDEMHPLPLVGCAPWSDESCVVLAQVKLPANQGTKILVGDIENNVRQTCLSTEHLKTLLIQVAKP